MSRAPLRIGDRTIGEGHPTFLIAEVGMAHDGSLGIARAHIDAAAAAGADAVKFQTHIADAESTPAEPFRVSFSRQDATRMDYWRRTAFTPLEWKGLAEHAARAGVVFLSSPFSVQAADMLLDAGVPAWKVASGEIANLPLIEHLAATGLPMLLSSGMSGLTELDAAVTVVRKHGAPLAVLQCTTEYPCPPERLGLNVLAVFRERYDCPVGLSDHSGTIYAGLAASVLGASIVEVHHTLSREMFGPDVPASVTSVELGQLAAGLRFVEKAIGSQVDKDEAAKSACELREIFTKSVVLRRELPAGTVLTMEMLAVKKPGTGIPAARLQDVVGRRLRSATPDTRPLCDDDLEPQQTRA